MKMPRKIYISWKNGCHKNSFPRSLLKELIYWDYKQFDREVYRRELQELQLNGQINVCNRFEQIFLETLNMHAAFKKDGQA